MCRSTGSDSIGTTAVEDVRPIQVLLIESDEEAVRTVTRLLVNETERRFRVTHVADVPGGVQALAGSQVFDLVLLGSSLAGEEDSRAVGLIRKQDAHVPIIFLGARKDLSMAVEAMRVGGRDFLPKEELDVHVFPQTLIRHHERHQLSVVLEQLEIRRGRLEAMQSLVVSVSEKVTEPLQQMRSTISMLEQRNTDEKAGKYLTLIRENLDRLVNKMERLKNLKDDKTVKYIKDIRMIDLS